MRFRAALEALAYLIALGVRQHEQAANGITGQAFYQQQQPQSQPGTGDAGAAGPETAGAGAATGARDDVVEADYEIVDDDKK